MSYLAIDLDGTLAAWGDDTSHCGEWMDGAQAALQQLLDNGDWVIVHSCRATWEEGGGASEIARFLVSGGFKPVACDRRYWQEELDPGEVGIWVGTGKPIAQWYIDDRGIEHRGIWVETLLRLRLRALVQQVA